MATLDIHQIKNHLPHRYPFLLLDRILSVEPQESLVALKNVTINEPYFEGHFQHRPVMPGVLILEAMAQASAILASYGLGEEIDIENRVYYFTGIDKARFKNPVEPGDQLEIYAEVVTVKRGMWKFNCTAKVEGELVTSAEILCTQKKADN